MLVSVCLPVFNGSQYLIEAIQSVLKQTHEELELLIADDSSTDDSWEIIQSFAENDSRVKIWRNKDQLGLFSNYNRTIGSAQGSFIKPFAQDDLMSPEALATMVQALQTNESASIASCKKTTGSSALAGEQSSLNLSIMEAIPVENLMQRTVSDHAKSDNSNQTGLQPGLNPGTVVILKCLAQYRNLIGEPVTAIFRKKEPGEQFSLDYHSIGDMELWFRLLEKGDLFYIPEALVTFRQHSENRTSELLKDLDWVLDFPHLSRQYADYIDQLGIDRASYCSHFLELAAPLVKEYCRTESHYIDSLPPYKELAYYLLRRLPAALDGEANYKSVLNSTSWRVTQPLRMFKRKLEKST